MGAVKVDYYNIWEMNAIILLLSRLILKRERLTCLPSLQLKENDQYVYVYLNF